MAGVQNQKRVASAVNLSYARFSLLGTRKTERRGLVLSCVPQSTRSLVASDLGVPLYLANHVDRTGLRDRRGKTPTNR